MARVASMTPSEALAQITAETGRVRGEHPAIYVTAANRPTVRKWLVAEGLPAAFVATLPNWRLCEAFNDVSNRNLDALRSEGNVWTPKDRAPVDAEAAEDIEPVRTPAPASRPTDASPDQVIEALRRLLGNGGAVDETRVREIIADEIARVVPRPVNVKVNDGPVVKLEERMHACFERVLRLVANGANVMLVGPAGCGKSHLCEQIARALNAEYGAIHGTAGASESALTGWLLPGEGGRFEYTPSRFVTLYEKGESLFCFDEIDAFDSNMLLVANGATANGHIHIAHRRDKPSTPRGKNVRLMSTANTYGTGANPMYAGRAPLDGSTLDRWIIVTVDYDRGLEETIARAGGITTGEMAQIWALRDKVREAQLRRTISTRAFQKAAIMRAAGDDWKTITATLVEGWTRDERAKVGM